MVASAAPVPAPICAIGPSRPAEPPARPNDQAPAAGTRDLKAEALASTAVQAMLDVFPAEIRDVEEM